MLQNLKSSKVFNSFVGVSSVLISLHDSFCIYEKQTSIKFFFFFTYNI